jgi:hypothetical protein
MNTFIALSYFAFALMMLGTAEDSHFRNDRWMFAVSVAASVVSGTMAVLYYVGVFAA